MKHFLEERNLLIKGWLNQRNGKISSENIIGKCWIFLQLLLHPFQMLQDVKQACQ